MPWPLNVIWPNCISSWLPLLVLQALLWQSFKNKNTSFFIWVELIHSHWKSCRVLPPEYKFIFTSMNTHIFKWFKLLCSVHCYNFAHWTTNWQWWNMFTVQIVWIDLVTQPHVCVYTNVQFVITACYNLYTQSNPSHRLCVQIIMQWNIPLCLLNSPYFNTKF